MNRNSEKKHKIDKQHSRSPKNSDHGLKSLVVKSKADPESDGYGLGMKSLVVKSTADPESGRKGNIS